MVNYIYVSDIATYIGQNKWSLVPTFERFWQNADKISYKNSLKDVSVIIEQKVVKKTEIETKINSIKSDDTLNTKTKEKLQKQLTLEITKVENEIVQNKQKVDDIVLTQKEKILKVVGKEMLEKITKKDFNVQSKKTDIEKELVEKKIVISTQHGTDFENLAVTKFEKDYDCKLDVSQISYKKNVNDNWSICGKCDGICDEKSFLVEIKNRVHKFFDQVRDYELSQVQIYMYITGYREAKLVQKFNRQIKVDDISYDSEYVDLVLKRLQPFFDFFESFIKDQTQSRKYILMNPKQKENYLRKEFIDKALKIY
jgi:hypothetical protein